MVYVSDGSAAKVLRELGNVPGADQGDVVVTTISPPQEIHCHTTQVHVFDLGVVVTRPDRGHVFVPTGNISSIRDAPEPSALARSQAGPCQGQLSLDFLLLDYYLTRFAGDFAAYTAIGAADEPAELTAFSCGGHEHAYEK